MVPHGVAYKEFKAASESAPALMKISEAAIVFMFESSRPFTLTEWAWTSDKKHEHDPKMWNHLVDRLSTHAKEVEEILGKSQRPRSTESRG